MDTSQFSIGAVIVILVVHLIMSVVYKDAEKKDKGFVFNWYKLSYRRKFIRSIWTLLFILILYITIYWFGNLTKSEYMLLGIIFVIFALLDITNNYVKWKRNEKVA